MRKKSAFDMNKCLTNIRWMIIFHKHIAVFVKSIKMYWSFHFVVQRTYRMTKCLENGKNCNDFTSNERLEYLESFQKLQKKLQCIWQIYYKNQCSRDAIRGRNS
jgi:hypothetical protein